MKLLTAFILLICLFFTVLGYHFICRFQISEAKSQMKRDLRNKHHEDIISFRFNLEESAMLDWENDHEFTLNGQMYDLLDKKESGNLLYINCIPDHRETALIDKYLKINQQNSSGNKPLASLYQLATEHFLPSQFSFPSPGFITTTQVYSSYPFQLMSRPGKVSTPPPQV